MPNSVDIGAPHMSPAEMEHFSSVLKQARRYLEFRMGGSTFFALRPGVQTIVSVDSDVKWTDAVKSHQEVAPRTADGSVSIIHGEIGHQGMG